MSTIPNAITPDNQYPMTLIIRFFLSAFDTLRSCHTNCRPKRWFPLSPTLDLPDVRFGSLADMKGRVCDVRFTPKSGHWLSALGCCAKSGHVAPPNSQSKNGRDAIKFCEKQKTFSPRLLSHLAQRYRSKERRRAASRAGGESSGARLHNMEQTP
jgi:hypothetical protein